MTDPRQVMAAHGGRIGRADGGTAIGGGAPQMSGFAVYPYLDTATPGAIAQGYGVPSPLSGVAQMEYSALTGGATGANTPAGAFSETGTESLSPSQPNLSGAAPGTVFAPINYTDPTQNFQTAAAANSAETANQIALRGLDPGSMGPFASIGANPPGGSTLPTNPAAAAAAGPPVQLAGATGGGGGGGGGSTTTNTPAATVHTPAPAPAAPAPAPAATPTSLPANSPALIAYLKAQGLLGPAKQAVNPNTGYGFGGPGAGTGGGSGYGSGGRIGRQDGGGLGSLGFYTPETGNARAAHYNPPVSPLAPPPTPQSIYTPPHIAPRHHPRAQVPLPPPRPPTPPAPMTPQPVASAPGPISLPPLNPDETKDPFVHYPDASFPQPSTGGPVPNLYDPELTDQSRLEALDKLRRGFAMGGANAGVMGQMPLQGALGYAPQGQGVTGMDSQGSAMGAGSTAKKAAGFDGLFGSGFQRGGRIGRQDGGGLGGFGVEPSQPNAIADLLKSLDSQPSLGDLLKAIDAQSLSQQHRGDGPPKPPAQQQQQSGAGGLGGLGGLGDILKNMGTNASHPTLGPGQTGASLADLANPPNADISSMNVDMNPADFGGEFSSGGTVQQNRRPGFWAGSGAGTTGGESAGPSPGPGAAGGDGSGGDGSSGVGSGGFGGAVANAVAGLVGQPGQNATSFGTNVGADNSAVSATFGNQPGPSSDVGPTGGGLGSPGNGVGGIGGGGGDGAATSPAQAETAAAVAEFAHQGSLGGLLGISPAEAATISLTNMLSHKLAQQRGSGGGNAAQGFPSTTVTPGMLGEPGQPTETVHDLTGQVSLGSPSQFGQPSPNAVDMQSLLGKLGGQFGVTGTSMGFPAGNPAVGQHGPQATPSPLGKLGVAGFGPDSGVATVANPSRCGQPRHRAGPQSQRYGRQPRHRAGPRPARRRQRARRAGSRGRQGPGPKWRWRRRLRLRKRKR